MAEQALTPHADARQHVPTDQAAPISTDDLRKLLDAATPRPWHAARNSAFWEVNPERERGDFSIPFTVADVCSSDPDHPDRGLQETNARLIALAPQLAAEVLALRADLAAPSAQPMKSSVDFVAAGVTTAHDHQGGLTSFDRLAGWAFDQNGENLHGFDADDAGAIYQTIEKLTLASAPSAPAEVEGLVPPAMFGVCQRCIENRNHDEAGCRLEDLRHDGEMWSCEYCWNPDESDKWEDAPKPATALTALQAENERLLTSGIAEIAAVNPNVMDYMRHWEARAEAAEAALAAGLAACDQFDGPVSKSAFVNGQATCAQQIRAKLREGV